MKARISVKSVEEIEDEAAEAVEVYESPPKGANPEDDDDPFLGEDGVLELDTGELEVEATFSLGDFPAELSLRVPFIGWDETEARMAAAHGIEMHLPASVTGTLERSWVSESGKSMALYQLAVGHGDF